MAQYAIRQQFAHGRRHLDELEAAFDPHESWPQSENDDDDDDELEKFKYRKRMCWCLVRLKNALKNYAGFSDEENAYMSSLQWDEVEGNFDIKFPRDEPLTYPVPVMGPLKGESPMKPFGRAWEILKYFSSVQGSRWSTRFGTAACQALMGCLGTIPRATSTEKCSGQAEENEIWIPESSLIMTYDPRVCSSAAMFWDLLRTSLNCQKLGTDLRKVVYVTYTTAGAEEGRLFSMDPWKTKWTDMKAKFNDPSNTEFLVGVKLRARSEDEMDHSILESDEVLPGLLPPMLSDSLPGSPEPEDDKEDEGLEASLPLMKRVSKDTSARAKPKVFSTKAEQLRYYDGHDVGTWKGRMNWQISTIESMPSVVRPVSRKDGVDDQFISPEAAKDLHQAHQAAHHSAEGELGTSSTRKDHILLQNAFGGTPARAGPPFDICLDLLLCEHVSGTDRYRCKLLGPSTKCDFFVYQINGAIGLLIKLLGAIDPAVLLKWASIPVDSAEAVKVKNAAAKLQHLRLHAAICADLTGFGKTKLILLTSLLYSFLADTNRPTLLLVPSALISQWTTEIETNWSYFRPILSYGEVLVNSQP
ncbi:hypothetical protein PENDEC_c048G01584 [Penicillium decumbens]|uniref:SNF2 N-terminal domain-containing protein n=1 Tax=Penicillium decumbens TaxID=69771 RepID=A0A1V6NNU6_PENDC|nr:hypothetical protein PENDEC_c048G01584 [Penicillium decumbens]